MGVGQWECVSWSESMGMCQWECFSGSVSVGVCQWEFISWSVSVGVGQWEWVSGSGSVGVCQCEWVSGSGSASSVMVMRKKINKHRYIFAHQKAVEIEDQREKEVLSNTAATVNAALFSETVNVLRTAYFVAKERLAFIKMSSLLSLQEINGTKMGPSHRSDHACINRIEHIAVRMRKKNIDIHIEEEPGFASV